MRVKNVVGRTDAGARLATVLARADRRAVHFFESVARMRTDAVEMACGTMSGPIDPDASYCWDAVQSWKTTDELRRAYHAYIRRLEE